MTLPGCQFAKPESVSRRPAGGRDPSKSRHATRAESAEIVGDRAGPSLWTGRGRARRPRGRVNRRRPGLAGGGPAQAVARLSERVPDARHADRRTTRSACGASCGVAFLRPCQPPIKWPPRPGVWLYVAWGGGSGQGDSESVCFLAARQAGGSALNLSARPVACRCVLRTPSRLLTRNSMPPCA